MDLTLKWIRSISRLFLFPLSFLHRVLYLVNCVWIVLVAQLFGQLEIQLSAGTDDMITVLIDPLGQGIVSLRERGKRTLVDNTSHFFCAGQVIDLYALP